ncbi:CoxG family protein [Oceanobacillus manasiensis]|uniref:CoxG family protein n=1 Tax=Oceanobacillus manasiensis TaxID=586413 RepID=UPI0005A6478E|nr:SRPBCC family protein [Oceanobacillus manasiensis]
MPSGVHQLEVDLPIRNTWSFVSNITNWATLVPGYVEHEILNERQSTWTFRGDAGVVHKTVCLKIDIQEWVEPARISFTLKGLNENFSGDGYFQTEEISKSSVKMTGYLHITAKGLIGPMINTMLRTMLPRTTKDFTEAVVRKMQRAEAVAR